MAIHDGSHLVVDLCVVTPCSTVSEDHAASVFRVEAGKLKCRSLLQLKTVMSYINFTLEQCNIQYF